MRFLIPVGFLTLLMTVPIFQAINESEKHAKLTMTVRKYNIFGIKDSKSRECGYHGSGTKCKIYAKANFLAQDQNKTMISDRKEEIDNVVNLMSTFSLQLVSNFFTRDIKYTIFIIGATEGNTERVIDTFHSSFDFDNPPRKTSTSNYISLRSPSPNGRSILDLSYVFTCDPHYYGEFCNTFCPPSQAYECNKTDGRKICFPFWWPPNRCDTFCRPQSCHTGHYYCTMFGEKYCKQGWTAGPKCLLSLRKLWLKEKEEPSKYVDLIEEEESSSFQVDEIEAWTDL